MIYLACGCSVTRKGNAPKVEDRCPRHETEPYTPSDWKGFQQRGPSTDSHEEWWREYDNYA